MEGRPFGEPGQLIAVTATGGALVGTVAGRYDALNRQKASLLGSLQEATVALSAATTTDEVCEHAVGIATEELGIPAAGVWAVTEGHPLRPIAVAGSVDGGYRPEDDVARTVFESGGTERRNDRSGRRRTDGSVGSEVVTSLDGTGVMCFASPEPGRFDHTDGTAVGLLASATEAAIARADREETLRTQRRLLEQQNERLEEFTSVVSHDLRNPLSVAKGRVDLAREADGGEDLDEAAAALNDMERLIEDLLALAKQGRMTGETEPVSLSAVAGSAWENVETGGAERRVDDAEFDADPDRLRQLFENLFRNAVEHGSTSNRPQADDSAERSSADDRTEFDSSVKHSLTGSRTESDDSVEHAVPDPTVDVGPLDDGGGFYVADDGPGIDPSDHDRIFEVGYTDHEDGTGFGLAIVKRIAEAHGWSVDVTAGADGGARFEFRFDGKRSESGADGGSRA